MQVGLGSMVTLGNKLLHGPIGQQRLADLEMLCLKCHHAEHCFTSNDHSNEKPRCGKSRTSDLERGMGKNHREQSMNSVPVPTLREYDFSDEKLWDSVGMRPPKLAG
jgi:hypothetical protein